VAVKEQERMQLLTPFM